METKYIHIELSKPEKNKEEKEEPKQPKKRVITTTEEWKFDAEQLDLNKQYEYVKQIENDKIIDKIPCKFIKQQINQKISGYKGQDQHKNLYESSLFINKKQVLELLVKSENSCFYCKNKVHVLYENVREPKQWTLERLDNDFGHNNNNVVLACLNCNLRRRTMHYERYLFTKELNIIKVLNIKLIRIFKMLFNKRLSKLKKQNLKKLKKI